MNQSNVQDSKPLSEIQGNLRFQIRFYGNWNIFKYKILKYTVFLPSGDLTFQNLKKAYEILVHDGPLAVSVSSAIKIKSKG